MSLRSAILALLRIAPMSGYDLAKQFSQSVGHVWHAPDSQIYPELRKMAEEGLILPEEQTRGTAGMRRMYHVTEAGEESFLEWMNSPLKYQRTRDASHLKAAYLESANHEARISFLRNHIEVWTGELEYIEDEIANIDALESPMLNRRLAVTADKDREMTIGYKRFAYEGLADRARSEIEWAQRGLKLTEHLDG
ncbi:MULTISPECIES: PadR family transcriptional regulator [Brevibacterium]|jgi:PadR family transcriptional regulator AphA|uniref:Transcriptional regulator, PadR-like family n=2 Tax=Brevibacterium TaxID=1696 RepID=A0A0B9AS89_BRELN|nr:PadR family transcriptional regulator [Brevibacterium linens]KHS53724.1 transcriptional regulator, PadR-like family [Brevibacterium linens]